MHSPLPRLLKLSTGLDVRVLPFAWILFLVPFISLGQYSSYEDFALAYGLPLASAEADPDGDGCTNLEEYYFGRDPLIPDCGTPLEIDRPQGSNLVEIKYTRAPGVVDTVSYVEQWIGGEWNTVAIDPFGPDGEALYLEDLLIRDSSLLRVRLERPQGFFRVNSLSPSRPLVTRVTPTTSLFHDDTIPFQQPNPFNGSSSVPPGSGGGGSPGGGGGSGGGPGGGSGPQPPVSLEVNEHACLYLAFRGEVPAWIDETWTFEPLPVASNPSSGAGGDEAEPIFYEVVFSKEFPPGRIDLPAFESELAEPYQIFVEEKPPFDTPTFVPEDGEDDPSCPNSIRIESIPPLDAAIKISEAWRDASARADLVENVTNGLQAAVDAAADGSQAVASGDVDNAFNQFGDLENPASSSSFWVGNVVGGYAAATARTRFYSPETGADWVFSTEDLQTSATGTRILEMTFEPDADCEAFVTGVTVARLQATSTVFDAVAGNNPDASLAFVRSVNFAGQAALNYLFGRADGSIKNKDFATYAAEEAAKQTGQAITQPILDELEAKGKSVLENTLQELGLEIDLSEIEASDFAPPENLADAVSRWLDIEIPDPGEWASDGIEALFGSFLASSTYAQANGSFVAKVGSQRGSAIVSSRALYGRQGTEDTDQAVTESGPDCAQVVVADTQPNSLRAELTGVASTGSKAKGNGSSEATLHSGQVTVLAGVCFCPDGYTYDILIDAGWFNGNSNDQGFAVDNLLTAVETNLDQSLADGSLHPNASPDDFSQNVRDSVEQWADGAIFDLQPCN